MTKDWTIARDAYKYDRNLGKHAYLPEYPKWCRRMATIISRRTGED